MTKTVLVIGGTGGLGAPVARQLRSDGYQVRLLVRDRSGRSLDSGFDHVVGDLDDPASLSSALAGCDAVHISVRGGPRADEYDRVEHLGTARVAQAAADAGVERLTYVSHMLAAPDAAAPDLRAKFHAEQAIAGSGVPYTIFRPTYFMETLPRHVRDTRAVVLGRQPHPFHMIAAADFARMVSRSLSTPEAAGKCLSGARNSGNEAPAPKTGQSAAASASRQTTAKINWQVCLQPRAISPWASDHDRPAQRLNPVGEAD